MIRLSPTSTRPSLLAFAAVAIIALLIGMSIRSGPVTSVVTGTATPVASAGASPSLAPTLEPTPFATRFPPLLPTPAPACTLPGTLPFPTEPVAAPVVERSTVSMLFTSFLYRRAVDGQLLVRNDLSHDWGVGLWFAPAATVTPRLIAATDDGMVLPLALSPNGDVAVVWWLPERRSSDQTTCISGIYLVSTVVQASRLLVGGDWTVPEQGEDLLIEPNWRDPDARDSRARSYLLPAASISRSGEYVAIRDGTEIAIYGPDPAASPLRHVGECTDGTWDIAGTSFIAGCQDMTSAWHVNLDFGLQGSNIALPWLRTEAVRSGWGRTDGSAIGLTRDGKIRIVGFYGFPTGCEEGPCSIPPPAYSVTTFDPGTNAVATLRHTTNFIVDYDLRTSVRFSGDASWVYADLNGAERPEDGARTITVASGAVAKARRLGTYVGSSADGALIYGLDGDTATGGMAISSLGANGKSTVAAIVRVPDGIDEAADPAIALFNLLVAAPAS